MNPRTPRRLAFELLEPKASPSTLLLALAPLGEPDQQIIESDRALYATTTSSTSEANVALLKFIERNTRCSAWPGAAMPLPTPEQAAAADHMMQANDTDVRTMLIAEMLEASSVEGAIVCSVIQF